jgi:hypothetical protein
MIKMLITGDFCPHRRVADLVASKKYDLIFNDFISELEGNDINITNLECPLTDKKVPILKRGPALWSPEATIKALTYGRINLVTLSNNHIMDQGSSGLFRTIELCRNNNIGYLGAGANLDDASRPLYTEYGGINFAFLNFSESEFSVAAQKEPGSNPVNIVSNYYNIRSARSKADRVIVIVHGGHEGYPLPSPRMKEAYRFYIDAGADLVVGHHSHCFSGFEKYNDRYIFYSLGNFLFDWENLYEDDWNYGYAVRFGIDRNSILPEIIPFRQCSREPGVFLLNESERKSFLEKLEDLNKKIDDDVLLMEEWNKLIESRRKYYLIEYEAFSFKLYKLLRYKNLLPGFLSTSKKLSFLNITRCEAHRDLVIEALKREIYGKHEA